MLKFFLVILFLFTTFLTEAQLNLSGRVVSAIDGEPVAAATVRVISTALTVVADANGKFQVLSGENDSLFISAVAYGSKTVSVAGKTNLQIMLMPEQEELEQVVVTGTMKVVKKLESPIAVEVYTPQFFKKNPAPSLFESLQQVNGVRPQLNCNVCNTGDIHINGLEGPYTMVTMDGMPIVSSLASVYGLFGIPTQLIDRIEIIKGPASGLYGSEAIGGLINVITKSPDKAPLFSANLMTTSWQEHNVDLGIKFNFGKKISSLTGINYFNYQHPVDRNNDQFTDVALQHRVSFFNKLNFSRKQQRAASLAGRYFYEDRWGGDMRWNSSFRGGDSLYGESIYVNRWELIGLYQLPIKEKVSFSFSATGHQQNSWYGITPYMADQKIGFGQMLWDRSWKDKHSLLAGASLRYNQYDDNSTATRDTLTGLNKAEKTWIPGIFLQEEWKPASHHSILGGLRWDHHPVHKAVITPRIAWKWTIKPRQVFRLNAGTGFRVVNLFTEEHAALTGARVVEIAETLRPEKSYNVNLNYTWQYKWAYTQVSFDLSTWYSHFTNQIIPDYDTDPQKIIYKNLRGYSSSKGISLNTEFNAGHRLKGMVGITIQDVVKTETNKAGIKLRQQPVLTEKWSGTWAITYSIPAIGLVADYTGNIYGPMRLPVLSAQDPRPDRSKTWSLQNIQLTKRMGKPWEVFGGIKNLLNWTPAKNAPFIIARSHDPFDKKVQHDANGSIVATEENPYALSFDPSYVFAPNQGLRFFAGFRLTIK